METGGGDVGEGGSARVAGSFRTRHRSGTSTPEVSERIILYVNYSKLKLSITEVHVGHQLGIVKFCEWTGRTYMSHFNQ